MAVRGWRESKILLVGDFFTGWREPEEEWFWQFEPFSKLKTAFCEYWTSIKMKINMTCVSKIMKLKQKWSKSNDYSKKCCFCWVITWKLLLSGGGKVFFYGEFFSRWSDWGWRANFWLVGRGTLTHPSQREKNSATANSAQTRPQTRPLQSPSHDLSFVVTWSCRPLSTSHRSTR